MIQPDTMEQIIKSQQEQITSLLTTNRSLVESNEKLLKQTDMHISVIPTQAFRSYPPSLFPIKWHWVTNL